MLAAQMRQYMASLRHNLRQILRYSAKIFNETPTRRRRLPLRRVAAAVTLTHTALQLNFVHTSTTHAHDRLSSVALTLFALSEATRHCRCVRLSAYSTVQYGLLSLLLILLRFAFCFCLASLLFRLSALPNSCFRFVYLSDNRKLLLQLK